MSDDDETTPASGDDYGLIEDEPKIPWVYAYPHPQSGPRHTPDDEGDKPATPFGPPLIVFDELQEFPAEKWNELRERLSRPSKATFTFLPIAKQTASGTPVPPGFAERWMDGLSPEAQRAKAEAAKAAWQAQQDTWIARIVTALGFPSDWQLTEIQRADLYALIDEVYDYGLGDDD